ncbi:hypothetical protein ABT214_31170 [Micromonospora purpureochromogenes]|uniref:hypothetical protein n=1 Tax=Micromonospora purpureochromogenes TaxID=47872 RepID=UPI00332688C8
MRVTSRIVAAVAAVLLSPLPTAPRASRRIGVSPGRDGATRRKPRRAGRGRGWRM